MGYKYGVWLVYNKSMFPTTHIGHFTITCYMEKEDAFSLYEDILAKYGKTHYIDVKGKKPIMFDENMYADDDNNMGSWGYEGNQCNWNNFKKCTNNYKCNFSDMPHTSVEYFKTNKVKPIEIDDICVKCTLVVADITNDDPTKWNLLKK